jgi:uncharacterized protein
MTAAGQQMRRGVLVAAALAIGVAAGAPPASAEVPVPDPPARWATDRANFLSAGAQTALDDRLAAYAQQTGHQLLVYIDHTTGGVPIEDWGARAFQRWRVGRKGLDDGVVLFIFSDDRRLRIEVGYGLEAQVPDARAAGIIREVLVPRMQAGDAPGAIAAGVGALLKTIGREAPGQQQPADQAFDRKPPPPLPWWAILVGGVVIALVLMGLATHPALAAWLLFSIASGRGSGGRGGGWGGSSGFGGGGGGFSGGGGRSGGGGASGSW